MSTEVILLAILVSIAIGGVAWVFLYPTLSGERHVEQRQASVVKAQPIAARSGTSRMAQKPRREQVEDTLKELDARNANAKKLPLSMRIAQAGLNWSVRKFWIISALLAVGAFLAVLMTGNGIIPALGAGFAAFLGLPQWTLRFLKKRRESRFLNAFPDAVDVIVRGIKAGLPLLDSIRIVSNDTPEPVKSEFRAIIETQTIGMPLGEACARLYERMPLSEANFFGIVVSIQQKSGGNLSEALGNLSRVLRDRKRMQAKIKAMSMEAKASAAIIAALPISVMGLVYMTSPNYIELLWTTPMGRMMMAASVVWMAMGVLVMRKMINFDF
jgi:tight adherence protein B